MSRGRKPKSNIQGSDWETVFYNSVGTYVQCINKELSNEYKLEPLSNHLKIVGGYAFKTAEYKKQGVPIIRISDFSNEQVVLDNVVFYEESKDLERYELYEGDIIIALTGGTIAKLAIVQADLGKIYLNQRVGRFRVLNPNEFEVEYIYWIARSVQNIIKNLAWGAAIPNVSPKQIEELEFPFPNKEIQKGIIAFLNDLKNNDIDEEKVYFNTIIEDKIILLHERQITTSLISTELTYQLSLVKNLRQQLLQDAVQGKLVKNAVYTEGGQKNVGEVSNLADVRASETGSQLLKRIKAQKAQLIKDKKLKKEKELPPIKAEEIPFAIPEDWVWCRLGEITNLVTSGSRDWAQYYSSKGDIFVRMGNLSRDSFDLRMDKIQYVNPPKNQEGNRTRLEEGDILVSITGEVGNLGLIPNDFGDAYINQHTALVRLNNFVVTKFICYLFLSETMQKQFNAPQRGMKNSFRLSDIDYLLIPLPPLSMQHRIVAKVENLMQLCAALETSIQTSAAENEQLLQQVLREALQGEVVTR